MMSYGPEDIAPLGADIAKMLRPGDVIGLTGELGVGKTTLARAILAALGLQGEAPSPSFAIVQPYGATETRIPVAHIDLYRIEHVDEIAELGLDEYRDDHVLLIEWPERMGCTLPPETLALAIGFAGEAMRSLTAKVPPAWEGRWPPR